MAVRSEQQHEAQHAGPEAQAELGLALSNGALSASTKSNLHLNRVSVMPRGWRLHHGTVQPYAMVVPL